MPQLRNASGRSCTSCTCIGTIHQTSLQRLQLHHTSHTPRPHLHPLSAPHAEQRQVDLGQLHRGWVEWKFVWHGFGLQTQSSGLAPAAGAEWQGAWAERQLLVQSGCRHAACREAQHSSSSKAAKQQLKS